MYILLNQVMILTSTYVFQILIGKQPLRHGRFLKKVNLPNKKLAIQKFFRTRCTTKQLLGRMHSPRKMGLSPPKMIHPRIPHLKRDHFFSKRKCHQDNACTSRGIHLPKSYRTPPKKNQIRHLFKGDKKSSKGKDRFPTIHF